MPPDPSDTPPLEITVTPRAKPIDPADAPAEFDPVTLGHARRGIDPADAPAEFAPVTAPTNKLPLEKSATDTTGEALLKGAATVGIKGVPHLLPGAIYGDVREFGDYLGSQATHRAEQVRGLLGGQPARPTEQVAQEKEAYKKQAQAQFSKEHPIIAKALSYIPQPYSGADISRPILEKTGEYEPSGDLGRFAMAAGEAGIILGRGARPGSIRTAKPAAQTVRETAKNVALGTVGGGAGAAAGEYAGPEVGAVIGSLVPGAAETGAHAVSDYRRPSTAKGQRSIAAEHTVNTTQDPTKALQKLNQPGQEILPGSKPTTADVSGDPAQALAEKAAQMHDPTFKAEMVRRTGQQNKVRQEGVSALSDPNASPEDIHTAFRQHLDEVEADHAAKVAAAEKESASQRAALPGNIEPEAVGGKMRETVEDIQKVERSYFNRMYDALDPDKTLHVVATPVRQAVEKIQGDPNRAVGTDSSILESMLKKAGNIGDVDSFDKLRAFDQTLTRAMKEARLKGDPGYDDIVALKGAVKDTFANAVKNQTEWEKAATARGEMPEEDTFAYKMRQQANEYQERKSWESARERASANGTSGQAGFSGTSGAGGPGTRGSSVPPGGAGVSGDVPKPNLTPRTAEDLAQLNKEYGKYKRIYGAEPVAGALKTRGFSGDYNQSASSLPARVFAPGDGGYEKTAAWLSAAKNAPDAINDVESVAMSRLRDTMGKDENLTQEALDKWKDQYKNALRAIDEADTGFSKKFDDAASATKALSDATEAREAALKEAQQGIAGKFLNPANPLEHADDIIAHIGGMVDAKNSGAQMTDLMSRVGHDPNAVAGVRKAVTDWMGAKLATNAIIDGEHIMSGAKLVPFVRDNPTAIKAVFGEEGHAYLQKLAQDLERQQQKLSAQTEYAGSDTARYITPKILEAQKHVAEQQAKGVLHGGTNAIALLEGLRGNLLEAGMIKGANIAQEKIQSAMEKRHGAGQAKAVRLWMDGLLDPQLGKELLQEGLIAKGKVDNAHLDRIVRRIQMGESQMRDEQERQARATGGSVKIDHAAEAAKLVRAVAAARKAETARTKPLLNVPDETVAKALALANGVL